MSPPTQIIQGEMRIPITFGTRAPWLLVKHGKALPSLRWRCHNLLQVIPLSLRRAVDVQDVMAGLQLVSPDCDISRGKLEIKIAWLHTRPQFLDFSKAKVWRGRTEKKKCMF